MIVESSLWEGGEKQRGIERGREKDERREIRREEEERKEQLRDNHTPNISTASALHAL